MRWKLTIAAAWIVPHVVGLLYGMQTFSPYNLLLFIIFYLLSVFGGTVGYHRYLAHKGFECGPVTRFVLIALGTFTVMGRPDQWAATHVVHHLYEDTENDPHSPQNGVFHAYIGWMFDARNFPLIEEYAAKESEDPIVAFISRYYALFVLASILLPFVLGGFGGLVWAGFIRMAVVLHVVGVSSVVLHLGEHNGKNNAKNCWWAALLTLGEGWHKYHHTGDERDPRHGRVWWQIDVNWYTLLLLKRLGLIRF